MKKYWFGIKFYLNFKFLSFYKMCHYSFKIFKEWKNGTISFVTLKNNQN